MTVAELIEKLKAYPEDLEVKRFDFDYDVVEVEDIYTQNISRNNPLSPEILVIN